MDFKEKPIKIGRISKVHGIQGGMLVESGVSLERFDNWPRWVFVYIDSGLVPFELMGDECFFKDDRHLVIFLKHLNRPEKCSELLGQSIYFPEAVVSDDQNQSFGFDAAIGSRIGISGHEGSGTLEEFLDVPGNPLLRVDWNGRELLIPAQAEFILDYDEKNGIILFELPDGLLDMN